MEQLVAQPQAIEGIPEPPPPVSLTEHAAQMVIEAMKEEKLAGHGLRVGVMGGGCSGLQYLLDFAEHPEEDDFVVEQHGVRVFVDSFSAAHLSGTVIDYVDDLSGIGFKFNNPKIVRSCGCGSSFST
jgi:iron-sulfur cluster assembly accessory protein